MRTTITLDRDLYEMALTMSRASGETLSRVIGRLVRAGLQASQTQGTESDELPAFRVSRGAPPISLAAVRKAWQEEG
jgi:hypothetical protein